MFDAWTVQDATMFFFPLMVFGFILYTMAKNRIRGLIGIVLVFLNALASVMLLQILPDTSLIKLMIEAYVVVSSLLFGVKSLMSL